MIDFLKRYNNYFKSHRQMKQSDLENQQNQNYFNLDTFTNWIDENVPKQKTSPLKPFLEKQVLTPSLNIKSQKQLFQSSLNRVEKNNKILSELINPENKPQRLELMEAEYDEQKCERALDEILQTAPKDQIQDSNSTVSKKRQIKQQRCDLIKLLRQEKKSNQMIPEQPRNPNQKRSKSQQKITQQKCPEKEKDRICMEEQYKVAASQNDFIDDCINASQVPEDSKENNAVQYFEIQYLEPDKESQKNQTSSEFKENQIQLEFEEIKTGMEQLYLEPLDAEIELLQHTKPQQIQKKANQPPVNNTNRIEEE